MSSSLYSSQIVEPYAQALMSVAQSHNLRDQFGENLRSLSDLLGESQEFREFVGNPVVKAEDKKAVLKQVLGAEASPYLLNFMMLLVDKRRIFLLESVCEQYLALLRELKGAVLAEVTSATALSEEQQQSVIAKVKNLTGATDVEIQSTVDPDLIGGVVVKVGSQVFDASLRGQLRRISISLGSAS